ATAQPTVLRSRDRRVGPPTLRRRRSSTSRMSSRSTHEYEGGFTRSSDEKLTVSAVAIGDVERTSVPKGTPMIARVILRASAVFCLLSGCAAEGALDD